MIDVSILIIQVSRMLAAKASLAARVDALGEDSNVELGMEIRAKVESRVRALEDGQVSVHALVT